MDQSENLYLWTEVITCCIEAGICEVLSGRMRRSQIELRSHQTQCSDPQGWPHNLWMIIRHLGYEV